VIGLASALLLLAAVGYLVTRGGGTRLGDLAPKDCYSPAVSDMGASIHRRSCDGAHGAEFIALFSPTELSDAYPGAEELALFGDGACRVTAERLAGETMDELASSGIILRIAVPDEQAWDGGEHRVACSFATPDAKDLTKPIG
jgi:hypothetical protein